MALLTNDEIFKQSDTRLYYQPGGPGTRLYFGGLETQYMTLTGDTDPVRGGVDPVNVWDPQRPGRYKVISRTISAPDLPTATVGFHEKIGGIARIMMNGDCPFNVYGVRGKCRDLSDWAKGWEGGLIDVWSNGLITSRSLGDRVSASDDNPLMIEAETTFSARYQAGTINYENDAGTQVTTEVMDVVYGSDVTCGNCGTPNDGTQFIYAITKSNVGSPFNPGMLVYSLNGGASWTTATITGIGGTAIPQYIGIAGGILFVGSSNVTSLFYTVLDPDTGAPTTWSNITLPVAMNDVYVRNPREIYFVAAATGTIYRTYDITVAPSSISTAGGATALRRIDGSGNTIVATGNSGLIIVSRNGGASWSVVSDPTSGGTVAALNVVTENRIFIGTLFPGAMYVSSNAGSSWSAVTTPISTIGDPDVFDIVFATEEMGYALVNSTSNSIAYLLTTMDGGYSWHRNDQTARTRSWPTFLDGRRIAVPTVNNYNVAANYVMVAGRATGGTDGVLIQGLPTLI